MKKDNRHPLPERELQIGKNLRLWRESKRLTRAAVAEKIKETASKIASYEEGRAALTWSVFLKLWAGYGASPRFIATGLGSLDQQFPGLRILIPQAPAKARFSEVYAQHLEKTFEAIARNELPAAMRDLERFLTLAKAGEVEATAVLAVADAAHRNHSFSKLVIISGSPAAPAADSKG